MNIEEARNFLEPSFDNRKAAVSILNRSLYINNAKAQIMRDKPCEDCAVMHGLYTGIASCCYTYLNNEEKQQVVDRWYCHQGGRCEGAALVILGD